jgi:NADH-quinone oxidoreductase subunit G
MAAVTTLDTITIEINDIPVEVPKGELLVESVKRLGLEIPVFCYHPRLKPVGMCRMCLVEVGFKQPDGSVRKMPKPQAGCTLPASENMVVYTDTEMVHRDRKGVLEFLLINHPLDCPICDRGGECPLQNNTLFYGPSTSRYLEVKRHLPKAFPLSEYVTLDLERCIQCGRCVRFTEEISGDSQLAFRFRGAQMQPSTFELKTFESKFSGNVIEICPVGALTSSKYRFRARPWDLETKPGICTVCSNGCSVWLDHRVGKLVRVNGRTNEAVNEEWTCDRGKFGHEFYNVDTRLSTPFRRIDDRLVACEWGETYGPIVEAFGSGACAALAGPMMSTEAYYLLQKLFRSAFSCGNLDHRWTQWLPSASERSDPSLGLNAAPSSLASFEEAGAILVFGSSLAEEEPMLFLRVRKAWFQNGAAVVVAHHSPTEADSFAHSVLRFNPGTESSVACALQAAVRHVKTGAPLESIDEVCSLAGIRPDQVLEAAKALSGNPVKVVTTHSLRNAPNPAETLKSLSGLAQATGGTLDHFALGANEMGAAAAGCLPDSGPKGVPASLSGFNTHDILKACAEGKIRSLWLAGIDPFHAYPDRELVERALESVEFLVYQGIAESEAMAFASIALPTCAPAEQTGSYMNLEGRTQAMEAILSQNGQAKPDWRIFAEFLLRTGSMNPYFNVEEIRAEMA